MKNNWNKILNELSYRVSSGIPDLTNEQHLMKLWDILKEEKWPINARVELLKNLDEAVKPKYYQADKGETAPKGAKRGVGPRGGTYYWANPDGSAADEKDIPKDKDIQNKLIDSQEISTTTEKEKNKELKTDEDYENSKNTNLEEDIKPTDEDFEKRNIASHEYDPEEIEVGGKKIKLPVTAETLEKEIFNQKPRRFPKRYLKLFERLLNSKRDGKKPSVKELIDASGAGINTASTSELAVGMASTLPEKERKEFFEILEKATNAQVDKGEAQMMDKDWLKSTIGQTETTLANIKEEFGDDVVVENFAWDTRRDVEEIIGLDNYSENKGSSTDTFFRVRVGDKVTIHESSNKKSVNANLKNPLSRQLEENASEDELPDKERRVTGHKQRQNKRNTDRLKSMTKKEIETLVKMSNMSDEELLKVLKNLPDDIRAQLTVGSGDKMKINDSARKVLDEIKKNAEFLPDNVEALLKKDGTLTGDMEKFVVRTNYMLYANEKSNGVDDGDSYKYLQNNIGIDKPYPEGSARDVSEAHTKFLYDNPKYLLDYIKSAFPLQEVLNGEESIAAGSNGISKEILKDMFGTDDINKIQENLQIRTDKNGKTYLVYSAKIDGVDREVPISNIVVRQKGLGYADSTTELTFHPGFQEQIHCSNKKIRKPNPDNYNADERAVAKRAKC